MDKEKSVVRLICRNTTATFTFAIIMLTLIGWTLNNSQTEYMGLFGFENTGLPFQSVIQILALSFVIGGLCTLLTSDLVFKKAMLLWRMVLMLLFSGVICFIFAIIFRWFPLDMREAWIAAVALFIVVSGAVPLGMVIKTKLLDRRYNKALYEYKSKLWRKTT